MDRANKLSQALPVLVEQDNIHRHLQRLQEIVHASDGSRVVGSDGHNQTIEVRSERWRDINKVVQQLTRFSST